MSFTKATVLYDFEGDEASGEITIRTGETVTVIRQDIGDGWWEAKNDHTGKQGLVPEAYLEIVSVPEPAMPPPPPPAHSVHMTQSWSTGSAHNANDPWNSAPAQGQTGEHTGQEDAEWDDDWDDDDRSTNPDAETNEHGRGVDKYGTVSKRIAGPRFSVFSKSGGDAFLLGNITGAAPTEQEKVYVMDTEYGPCWAAHPCPFTCVIASPKKESKFKGMKSFIAYQLTPSFSNIQVSRRYKHFDWLHARLAEKFPCVAVPPLPDKQVTGRYEEDFIAERMRQLQLWVDRMVRHPLVGPCFTMMHFMECGADEKVDRNLTHGDDVACPIEQEYSELNITTIYVSKIVNQDKSTEQVHDIEWEQDCDTNAKFMRVMDDNVRHLMAVMDYNGKKHQGPFKREFQKIGASFEALASGFEIDTGVYSTELTKAIHFTAKTYNDIGNLYAQQPNHDSTLMMETLNEYKGLLSVMPDMTQTHKGALAKVRECQKLQEEGKMSEADLQAVIGRGDTISYAIMAEQKYFQLERVADFRLMMQHYLKEQIGFYKKITSKLEEALQHYETSS